MTRISFFIDDSGVFHENANDDFFTYAGYCFISQEAEDKARKSYKRKVAEVRKRTGRKGELKAADLDGEDKRELYLVLRGEYSFAITVNLEKLSPDIMDNKYSRARYKDFLLRRILIEEVKELIRRQVVDRNAKTRIVINLDRQFTIENSKYDLRGALYEELHLGYRNFDYTRKYGKVLPELEDVAQIYHDSREEYLIQAADILANRIFNSYRYEEPDWRKVPNHLHLLIP